MKTQIKTYLPCFNGYYGSIFEASSEEQEIDNINDERAKLNLPDIDYDACEWDYSEYYKDMSEKITDTIEGFLQELYPSISIKYEKTVSPKEYNFTNDSINIELYIDEKTLGKIYNYLLSHKPEFEKYLGKYTSCSGFISSYSDQPETWLNEYWKDIRTNGHYLGSILECNDQPWFGSDQTERNVNTEDFIYTIHVSENELEIDDYKINDNILDYPFVMATNWEELIK